MGDLDWDDIRLFLALFRLGSVRQASESLGMSHSSLSRHLTEMEAALGGALFTRSRDGLTPTNVAERIFVRAQVVEEEMLGLQREATDIDAMLTGEVRISSSPMLTQGLIMPILAEFSKKYPGIELIVHSQDELVDLMRGSSDLAIRSQASPDKNLVGRRLPDVADFAYASPAYLEKHDFEGDETTATWLGRGRGNNSWVSRSPFPHARVCHEFPDGPDQAQAALAGLGMTVLPCFYADRVSGLVRIPSTEVVEKRRMWVLTHPDLRTSARIRTLVAYLGQEMGARRQVVGGD